MINKVIIFILLIATVSACKNASDETRRFDDMQRQLNQPKHQKIHKCYQAVSKYDTAYLELDFQGPIEVNGKLSYNFFEKDDQTGGLKGIKEGDTIKLDYQFASEGETSFTDKYFIIKDKKLYEATGNMYSESRRRMVFTNLSELKIGETFIFEEISCK